MNIDFWEQRWQENQIGFHLDQVNPNLVRHWQVLGIPQNGTVFVPLCGKSLDLVWLREQGYRVLGVECSQLAVESFFREQQLAFEIKQHSFYRIYTSDSITLFNGDFFQLDKALLAEVDLVYDRASLVALPPEMRQQYAMKLQTILPAKIALTA